MFCNNMNNIENRTKTILLASIIVAMILPFGGMEYAEAKKTQGVTDEQLIQWATTAAELQTAIDGGDTSEHIKNRLVQTLDNLNDNGVTMEGQGLEVLDDYYSDGINKSNMVTKCGCDHSMKIRAAYEYFKYHLFGINFYGHNKGPWSANMEVVGDEGISQVQVKTEHVHTPIRAYSVTASDDRPTTVVYNVQLQALNDDDVSQFPSGTIDFTDLSATFVFFWDRHNSPKTEAFTPTDTWLITVTGELDAIS